VEVLCKLTNFETPVGSKKAMSSVTQNNVSSSHLDLCAECIGCLHLEIEQYYGTMTNYSCFSCCEV